MLCAVFVFPVCQDGRGEGVANMHRELEKCERALTEYLDMKKNVFPRFATVIFRKSSCCNIFCVVRISLGLYSRTLEKSGLLTENHGTKAGATVH